MTIAAEIERRAERIATLFFQRSDIKHRFLTDIIARELRYVLVEQGVLDEEPDTSYTSPSPKTQSGPSRSRKGK